MSARLKIDRKRERPIKFETLDLACQFYHIEIAGGST